MSMGEKTLQLAPVAAMVVPLPQQSHLNLLLHLSYKILSYSIPVYYVASTRHVRQIRSRAQGFIRSQGDKIQFRPFAIPLSTLNNGDSYALPFLESYQFHLRQSFAGLLAELSKAAKRIVVIHDAMMASVVQDAAFNPIAETYAVHAVSALALCSFVQDYLGKPLEMGAEVPSSKGSGRPGDDQVHFLKMKAGDLYITTRELEATWIDILAKFQGTNGRQWAIGPLNPMKACSESLCNSNEGLFKWLAKQEPRSVLYVAFGTSTAMVEEQTKELALGLEQSGVKFIWVLGDTAGGEGDSGTIELPEGFETRIEGKGMVLREWAPQLEILEHKSIGGFMSHCGWGSCMESISMGVPIAAWPMHTDQPSNAALVTEHLKAGTLVRKWEQKEETVSSSVISEVVRKLMVSEEGKELQKRAQELRRVLQQSVTKGGASHHEFESFISYATR